MAQETEATQQKRLLQNSVYLIEREGKLIDNLWFDHSPGVNDDHTVVHFIRASAVRELIANRIPRERGWDVDDTYGHAENCIRCALDKLLGGS